MQRAIPLLKAQGGGNVVRIPSCRTLLPMPGGAVPDMCRAAENALVRSLAIELAPAKSAVNGVAPNFLSSEAYDPRAVFIDDPRGRAFVEASVPAGRLGGTAAAANRGRLGGCAGDAQDLAAYDPRLAALERASQARPRRHLRRRCLGAALPGTGER